jgi:hypothetical protein
VRPEDAGDWQPAGRVPGLFSFAGFTAPEPVEEAFPPFAEPVSEPAPVTAAEPVAVPMTLLDVWRRLHDFHRDGTFDEDDWAALGDVIFHKIEDPPDDVPRPPVREKPRGPVAVMRVGDEDVYDVVAVTVADGDEVFDAIPLDALDRLLDRVP